MKLTAEQKTEIVARMASLVAGSIKAVMESSSTVDEDQRDEVEEFLKHIASHILTVRKR